MITLYLRLPRYSWNIVESDVKHHQTNKLYLSFLWWIILEIIHNVTNYKRNAVKLVSKLLKGWLHGSDDVIMTFGLNTIPYRTEIQYKTIISAMKKLPYKRVDLI